MTTQADQMVDRRRLKRRLRLWRAMAVIAVIAAIAIFALGDRGTFFPRNHIARVTIQGVITDDVKQQKLIDRLTKSNKVKAVIIRINSPGGTTTGAEALFGSIRKLSAQKPVVAVLGTVAASGGYITALAADYIVARGNTITGSIGVIFQWAQVTGLLEKLGVKMENIKSGPLKAVPSPFEPTTEEARKAASEMVLDSFEWFVGLVSDRRPIDLNRARILSDGRVYTGRKALENKLIDEIGGEEAAIKWLTTERKITPDLKVIDWRVKTGNEFGLGASVLRFALKAIGLGGGLEDFAAIKKMLKPERLSLDGLVSVWQPER